MPAPSDLASTSIVIADDSYLVREAVARLLDAEDDLTVTGVAGSYDELLALVDELAPDVVVTDIRMPPTGTDEGIAPRPGCATVTRPPESSCSASSLLRRTPWPSSKPDRIAAPTSSRIVLPMPTISSTPCAPWRLADRSSMPRSSSNWSAARSQSSSSPVERLTPREREILGEMAQGKSNAAIAATLFLSERAVEKHINSIFSKLHLTEEPDINRRVKAVLVYLSAAGS